MAFENKAFARVQSFASVRRGVREQSALCTRLSAIAIAYSALCLSATHDASLDARAPSRLLRRFAPLPLPLPYPPPPQLLRQAGLTVTDLSAAPTLDVTIDGADEVELPSLDCIKGGGGCHTEEKVVAAAAKTFVLIVDYRKCSTGLLTVWRKGVPVEVLPFALGPVRCALEKLGATVVLRSGAPGKAGPIVTDQGGLILDCDWGNGAGLGALSAAQVDAAIQAIPGVVETGFFLQRAHAVYIGNADGTAVQRKRGVLA